MDPRFNDQVTWFHNRVQLWRQRVDQLNDIAAVMDLETAYEELRAAEEALREQNDALISAQGILEQERERYRQLFHHAPEALIVTDKNGIMREANPAATKFLNIQPRYVAGKSLLHYFDIQGMAEARGRIEVLFDKHSPTEWRAEFRPRDLDPFTAVISIAAIARPREAVTRLTAIRWCIRRAEPHPSADQADALRTQLEQLREQLAESSALQAQLLHERELRERTEEALRVKNRFLAHVCHELQGPLSPVLASVESLLSHRLPSDLRDLLEMMRRNLLVERRLIHDLVDLSRLAHGKMELNREPLDLALLLREIAGEFEGLLAGRGISLVRDLPEAPGAIVINGDPVRLRQVFTNLLGNALKFTPSGGHISIGAARDGQFARVNVSDTGIGIAPIHLHRIFNAFEQTDSPAARGQGGLGLGLSIVRSLVEAHGGSVEADSHGEGTGATFKVLLPLFSGTLPEKPSTLPAITRPMRILLVEDHPDTARAMAKLLSGMGHGVTAAASVREAVDCLKRRRFDLLLADARLPDGSGADLLSHIPPGKFRKAIAVTGMMDPDEQAQLRSAGFSHCLLKPLSLQELLIALADSASPPPTGPAEDSGPRG